MINVKSARASVRPRQVVCRANMNKVQQVAKGAAAGAAAAALIAGSANVYVFDELNRLTYMQVKGTGIANTCSVIEGGDNKINLPGGKYTLENLCLEPTSFTVKEENANGTEEFVKTKLMTRLTYTLDQISGDFDLSGTSVTFTEKDGIDYAATTVQMPGGERVPFLFTIKELVLKGNGGVFKPGFQMGGDFTVPSYRTGLFLDPKGRGGVVGYDLAVALPGLQSGVEGDDELFKENNKVFDVTQGRIEMEVNKVNANEGEIGGVFVSTQLSDTDMGSKIPKKVLSKGIFYARVD